MPAAALSDSLCRPLPGLLTQVIEAAANAGVALSGENALQRYDHFAFDRIAESAFGHLARAGRLEQLTFLRMGDLMFDNWYICSVCVFDRSCCCFRYCIHSLCCTLQMQTCVLKRAGRAQSRCCPCSLAGLLSVSSCAVCAHHPARAAHDQSKLGAVTAGYVKGFLAGR